MIVADGSGAWWRRGRHAAVVTTSSSITDQLVIVSPLNSFSPAAAAASRHTLVLPSTMPASAASSPGVTKPAGASPLVPSWRSAFSAAGLGGPAGQLPTSPYSDSAATAAAVERRVTSVRQMAQLFEDASSRQHDVRPRRQHHHQLDGVDVLAQMAAAERHKFTVNSQLFFFPTSSPAAASVAASSVTISSTTSKTTSTVGGLRLATKSNADLRVAASGTTGGGVAS